MYFIGHLGKHQTMWLRVGSQQEGRTQKHLLWDSPIPFSWTPSGFTLRREGGHLGSWHPRLLAILWKFPFRHQWARRSHENCNSFINSGHQLDPVPQKQTHFKGISGFFESYSKEEP